MFVYRDLGNASVGRASAIADLWWVHLSDDQLARHNCSTAHTFV
jgi:hypothetical protein